MSSLSPAFIMSWIGTPSLVTAGRSRSAAKRAWVFSRNSRLTLKAATISAWGRRWSSPLSPSIAMASPARAESEMPSTDPISGRFIERATMATWLVEAASSSTRPARRVAAIVEQFRRAHAARAMMTASGGSS